MVKNNIIKMEFTLNSSNLLNIIINEETDIICWIKSAGKIGDEYFSAKFKFTIKILELKIIDIFFLNITHIGYDNSNKILTSDTYSDIIIDTFEQKVNNSLSYILNNTHIQKVENNLTLNFINYNENSDINFLVFHIKPNILDWDTSNSNKKNNSDNIINSSSEQSTKLSKIKKLKSKVKNNNFNKNMLKLLSWSIANSFIMHNMEKNLKK